MMSSEWRGRETSQHVHEGREERRGEEVAAGRQELVQADLPMWSPVHIRRKEERQ